MCEPHRAFSPPRPRNLAARSRASSTRPRAPGARAARSPTSCANAAKRSSVNPGEPSSPNTPTRRALRSGATAAPGAGASHAACGGARARRPIRVMGLAQRPHCPRRRGGRHLLRRASAHDNVGRVPAAAVPVSGRTEPEPSPTRSALAGSGMAALALGALGVVYGDIGTSPLYAVQAVFTADNHAVHATQAEVYGVISLVF